MTFATPARLALVLSAGALALTACGSSYADTKPAQVRKDIEKAMGSLTSVHVEGQITEDGEKGKLDLSVDKDGNCEGTFELGGVGSFEIISVDGQAYFKPDAGFWEAQAGPQGAAIAEMVGDKWVVASEGMEDIASICDLDELVGSLSDEIENDFKVGEATIVDGEDVVTVTYTSEDGNKTTGHVLSSAPHYLVDFDTKDEGKGQLSDFNKKVDAEAPGADEIVDLSKLAG